MCAKAEERRERGRDKNNITEIEMMQKGKARAEEEKCMCKKVWWGCGGHVQAACQKCKIESKKQRDES